MPVTPAAFAANAPVTASVMNAALYSYQHGNGTTTTGILFHANRPVLVESLTETVSQASSSSGVLQLLYNPGGWNNYFDSSMLFGPGADAQFDVATGQFNPSVMSTGGDGIIGGLYMGWTFPAFAKTTNAGAAGAGMSENQQENTTTGVVQLSSTSEQNCAYALDIFAATQHELFSPMGYCIDTSANSFAYAKNAVDYSGNTTRFYGMWIGVGSGPTLSAVPSPQSWSNDSVVTSAILNGTSVNEPLQLLNNPPVLRAFAELGTGITAGVVTTVQLSSVSLDTYGGYSTSARAYTVPLSGVYLALSIVRYAPGTGGAVYAGIAVNGSSTYWGPSYSATVGSGQTCPGVMRMLDLHAGDVVQFVTQSTGSTTLYSGTPSYGLLVWMCALANSNNSVSWTVPDTSYRWQPGVGESDLVAAFQQHLTNDVSFLIERPYLLSYQATAQTGLAQNAFQIINMDTQEGIVHNSPGDNYGAWNASTHKYTAPVPGWYLVMGTYKQSTLTTAASCRACIGQAPAGSQTPDWYQYIAAGATPAVFPGADALGLYYLNAGDSIWPVYQQQNGGTTFSTISSAHGGHACTFSLVWVCS